MSGIPLPSDDSLVRLLVVDFSWLGFRLYSAMAALTFRLVAKLAPSSGLMDIKSRERVEFGL